jgi:hypothetical protein
MLGTLSALTDIFHCNEKRPPTARQRRIEGLTTRRLDLPMAVTHPTYPRRSTFGNLPHQEGRANG